MIFQAARICKLFFFYIKFLFKVQNAKVCNWGRQMKGKRNFLSFLLPSMKASYWEASGFKKKKVILLNYQNWDEESF